jgi:hypothetical protein
MKQFCENPNCDSPGFREVPVSVNKPFDQKRTLCAACEEAYVWGVQHGRMVVGHGQFYVVAAAERGIVALASAFRSVGAARKELFAYLRRNHGYEGREDIRALRAWLRQHDEKLDVKIVHQMGLKTTGSPSEHEP